MRTLVLRSLPFVLIGLGLDCLALLAIGAGHGTYLVLDIVSAPAIWGGVLFAILWCPLFWVLVGMFTSSRKTAIRAAGAVLCLLHYAGVGLVVGVTHRHDIAGAAVPMQTHPIAIIALLAVVLYVTMQGLIWARIFRRTLRSA